MHLARASSRCFDGQAEKEWLRDIFEAIDTTLYRNVCLFVSTTYHSIQDIFAPIYDTRRSDCHHLD